MLTIAGSSSTKAVLTYLIKKANALPNADTLLEIMEKTVAKLPEEQRAGNQQKIDRLKADFLTNAEFREALNHLARGLDPDKLSEEQLAEVGEYIEHQPLADN